MARLRWTHPVTISLRVGPEGGEDEIEVPIRLYVGGSRSVESATIDLVWFEIGEWTQISHSTTGGLIRWAGKFRRPIPGDAANANDAAIIAAVDAWWAEHADECWDSLDEGDE